MREVYISSCNPRSLAEPRACIVVWRKQVRRSSKVASRLSFIRSESEARAVLRREGEQAVFAEQHQAGLRALRAVFEKMGMGARGCVFYVLKVHKVDR